MNESRAVSCVEQLQAAYPMAPLQHETIKLYLRELRRFDPDAGEQAVRSALEACRFFPTIAELHEHYRIAREQRAREQREEERRQENAVYDDFERVPLREIPAAVELLQSLTTAALTLPEEGEGDCSDCGKNGLLYRLGKVRVCAPCATSRLRAGEILKAEASA